MIRPPSLSKSWDEYVSIDPVFVQRPAAPADDADDETKVAYKTAAEEYDAKLTAAHQTGNWEPMLAPGRTLVEATRFTMLQVDSNIWREVLDRSILPLTVPTRIGPMQLRGIMTRLSLKAIVGLDFKVERSVDPQWGYEMAHADAINYLDAISPRVVGELAERVVERLRGLSPL